MEAQRSTGWREYRRALWRFVLLALQPWPLRWPRVADFVIAIAGAAAAVIIGFVEHSTLIGVVVFLGVVATLLLIAGTRVEREFRGDFGIRIEKAAGVEWVRLAVTNDSGAWAQFRADVTAVKPRPPGLQESGWAIAWSQTRNREEKIEPHGGTQYLYFCQGDDVPPQPYSLRKSTAYVVFKTTTGVVRYSYDDPEKACSPITVSMRVSRLDSHAKVEEMFSVWLDYDESRDALHPWRLRVMPTSQLPPTPSAP